MYGMTWFEILFTIFLLFVGLALEFSIDVWRERRFRRARKTHEDTHEDQNSPDEPHIS